MPGQNSIYMKESTKTKDVQTKTNLFMMAKKADTTKTTSKSKTPSLPVPSDLEPIINEYVHAKGEYKNWETKKELAEGQVKETARKLFLEEYKKQGRNIGSFKLGPVTISVQDRYTKVTEETASIIEDKFPDVILRKTTYLFNQEILEKYFEQISDALQSAEGIPEEDLMQLIQAKEEPSVKSGTIDTLATYGNQMEDLFQVISPIISMR